jgi:hypothetical protein
MKNNKKKPVLLPLSHALAWIVASALLISGSSHLILKRYFTHRQSISRDPRYAIHSIIQTGPQKEALKTEYLAELLGVSRDRPYSCLRFDLERAKQRLLQSPLISTAQIKLIKPSTLYVDYTVRQPIAWIEDYVNIAIDKEGYLFPFTPFFSPKHLPSLYLGLPPFGISEADPERPSAQWNTPMCGKYIDLAFKILAIVIDPKAAHAFSVKRIDVSNAFAESYGTREIVVMTEDRLIKQNGVEVRIPRILRLSSKNYAQELGNYLKLREQLLAEEKQSPDLQFKEKIIDFRIQKLAFIE